MMNQDFFRLTSMTLIFLAKMNFTGYQRKRTSQLVLHLVFIILFMYGYAFPSIFDPFSEVDIQIVCRSVHSIVNNCISSSTITYISIQNFYT